MGGFDNISETVRTVDATTTLTRQDTNLFVIGATGAVVVSVPSPLCPPGREYTIYKDAAAFTVTITPLTGLIDGSATKVLAASAVSAATIVFDGTNWFSVSSY